ncbi:MAG: hypothetical protein ACNA8K_03225 [Cyclonatronaceae bacterium]
MSKQIKIYDLNNTRQADDDMAFCRSRTPEEKLIVLEEIRYTWNKLNNIPDENQQRLQRSYSGY